MRASTIPQAAREFDSLADSVLVNLNVGCIVSDRSRSSIYRDIAAGKLKLVKVGHSSKLRVGDLRRLIGAA